jgi:hypothetical protein
MEGMEVPAVGTEPSYCGTPVEIFPCKNHADLSSRMTEGCMFNLTEEIADAML